MIVKVNDQYINSEDKTLIEFNRAIDDLLYIYYHPKMFINEKNYTSKLVANLFELRYYRDIESLFLTERNKRK